MKQFNVTGMTCAACQARVEKAVSKVEGVTECSVSLLTNSMGVSGNFDDEAILKAVTDAGYGASVKGSESKQSATKSEQLDALKDKDSPLLIKRLVSSLFFLLVLMYVSMGHVMWGWPMPSYLSNPVAIALIELVLTVLVMVINQRFFVSGFKSLMHLSPNMDTLVALGSAAAFIYSLTATFNMAHAQASGNLELAHSYLHDLYYESAAMILALITLGKMLEAHSKGKTTNALKSLISLAPTTATLLKDGVEKVVPATSVMVDDIFVVKPGEAIPVDAVIISGESAVDESSLTGEPIPVDKAEGAQVSAGTLNQSGFITCRATHVGEDTTLSKIIQMVSDAAATKAPIAKVADKVSGVFVPAVIAIAVVTTIVWLFISKEVGYSLARGISVLVISCPCALGLATPVAIMVGNGMGAKNGILFKTSVALENTGKADIVVLDKTGTITMGKPSVTDIIPFDCDSEKLVSLAYSIEVKSEHPLAYAVCTYAVEKSITPKSVDNFKALAGNGLSATLDGKEILGGSLKFISSKIQLSSDVIQQADQLAMQGKTPLLFAFDNQLLGIIAVADTIKPDSVEAISELKNMGFKVVMLTGDNERTANAIGALAGVDQVVAGVLPDGKDAVIRNLQKQGKVIMVGDGINDAPALTSADIGMAIGAGADVAIDAADVVLMKSQLSDVPAAIRLSRATLNNIHQNLFWAFFYNSIGIPLAAGVFIGLLGWQLNPMFAAACMSLSSFCVVTNALRLNLFNMRNTKRDHKFKKKSKTKKEDKNMTKTMKINGMMCGHCEMHTKKALEALDGVVSAEVSHVSGTAVVTLSKEVSNEALKNAVTEQGYEVVEIKY